MHPKTNTEGVRDLFIPAKYFKTISKLPGEEPGAALLTAGRRL